MFSGSRPTQSRNELVQLCEQKRSALKRAETLRQQLELKADELSAGAAAERKEAEERLGKLRAGASRVHARCAALAEELQVTKARSRELQVRRDRLLEMQQGGGGSGGSRRRGTTPPKSKGGLTCTRVDAESVRTIVDVLLAFTDGATALFAEHFMQPIQASVATQSHRLGRICDVAARQQGLRQMRGEDGNEQFSQVNDRCTAQEVGALSDVESLLRTYADLTELAAAWERGACPATPVHEQFANFRRAIADWRSRFEVDMEPRPANSGGKVGSTDRSIAPGRFRSAFGEGSPNARFGSSLQDSPCDGTGLWSARSA